VTTHDKVPEMIENLPNEQKKRKNTEYLGIGYRAQLHHYDDKIYVNYTSVFFIFIRLISQFGKTRGLAV